MRLRWSECVPIVAHSPGWEQEIRVDTPDDDECLRRVREALQRDSLLPGVQAAAALIQIFVRWVGAVLPGVFLAGCMQKTKMVTVECPAFMGRCWSGTV